METSVESKSPLGTASKQVAQRLFVIVENRLQLLLVEAEEERTRLLQAIGLALGVAVFGLLAVMALTVALVVALWDHSPIITLLALTALYVGAAILCFWRLDRLQRNWQTLPDTLEQLRKDRKCLEQSLF
jgi:uncharacterized membrane protein YqjE